MLLIYIVAAAVVSSLFGALVGAAFRREAPEPPAAALEE